MWCGVVWGLTDGSVRGHGCVLLALVAVESVSAVELDEEDLHHAQVCDERHADLHEHHLAHPVDVRAAAVDVVVCRERNGTDTRVTHGMHAYWRRQAGRGHLHRLNR